MKLSIEPGVPLTMDEDDVARMANSRITLDTVVYGINEGASAEEISAR
jgi:hypothetical protein